METHKLDKIRFEAMQLQEAMNELQPQFTDRQKIRMQAARNCAARLVTMLERIKFHENNQTT